MSKLPLITAKDMATVLESIGFRKGEDLHRGLIRSILRNAELSIEGYLALRKKI